MSYNVPTFLNNHLKESVNCSNWLFHHKGDPIVVGNQRIGHCGLVLVVGIELMALYQCKVHYDCGSLGPL